MKKLAVVVLALAAATGCPPDKAPQGVLVVDAGTAPVAATGDPAKPDAPAEVSKTAISALPMEAPVLIVEDAIYKRADIERAIAQHAASMGMPPDALTPRVRDALEQPAYDKLLDRHLMGAEARRRGLWPDDAAVRTEKEKILRSMPPAMTIETFFKKLGTDDAGLSKEIATDLALSKLFETLQKEQKKPDEAALRKIYDDNKAQFRAPELASASHILVRLEPGAAQEQVAEATRRAEDLRKEVLGKDKAVFAKVAQEKSDDPSAQRNQGNLGKFPRGSMVKAFEDAAFKLKDGEISEVVRSDFGLHIIRGQGTTPAGQIPFEEMKAAIADDEGGRVFMEALDRLIDGLRKKAKVQRIVEPTKSELGEFPGGPPPGLPVGAPPPPPAPAPPAPPTPSGGVPG